MKLFYSYLTIILLKHICDGQISSQITEEIPQKHRDACHPVYIPTPRRFLTNLVQISSVTFLADVFKLICHDGVIKWKHFPSYWHFVREITDHRWIPLTKASDADIWCLLWFAPEQKGALTLVTLVIWDAIVLIMTSVYWSFWWALRPASRYFCEISSVICEDICPSQMCLRRIMVK